MHRLPTLRPAAPSAASAAAPQVEAGRYSRRDDEPWSLFVPLHYEANYAYPLVVWFHGPGGDESQLQRLMPLLSLRNYAALAVRGIVPHQAESGSRSGYDWSLEPGGLEAAGWRLGDALLSAQERLHIAPHRIFLAGFDRGATVAWRLALEHPGRFAGVLSLGGAFPRGGAPLARLGESRRVPIFLACGQSSRRFPAEQVCEDLRLLHAAGMSVDLRLYPCGQEITEQMLTDMNRWMMALVTGQPKSAGTTIN